MILKFYFRGEPSGSGRSDGRGGTVFDGPAEDIGEHYSRSLGLKGDDLLRWLAEHLRGHWTATLSEDETAGQHNHKHLVRKALNSPRQSSQAPTNPEATRPGGAAPRNNNSKRQL